MMRNCLSLSPMAGHGVNFKIVVTRKSKEVVRLSMPIVAASYPLLKSVIKRQGPSILALRFGLMILR